MSQPSNRGSPALPFHYAWIVAGVTFLILIVTAGIRATPGVLLVPLETEFGWSRAAISAAVAINIALFGLIGPFATSAMNRWGMRRLILTAAVPAGRRGISDDRAPVVYSSACSGRGSAGLKPSG